MKSIWFKAGEMEDDLSSEEDKKKKRSLKSRKQKLSSAGSKLKRIKSERQKPTSTSETVDPLSIEVLPSSKAITPTTSSSCESTSPLTQKKVQVSYPSKSSLSLPANFLSSNQTLAPFRIPKKSPSDMPHKTDINPLKQLSDADSTASFTLSKMATSVKERGFRYHQKELASRNHARSDSTTQTWHSSHSINCTPKATCNYPLPIFTVPIITSVCTFPLLRCRRVVVAM